MPRLPRGKCAVCRRDVALRNDGSTREHKGFPPAADVYGTCDGSGGPTVETQRAAIDAARREGPVGTPEPHQLADAGRYLTRQALLLRSRVPKSARASEKVMALVQAQNLEEVGKWLVEGGRR